MPQMNKAWLKPRLTCASIPSQQTLELVVFLAAFRFPVLPRWSSETCLQFSSFERVTAGAAVLCVVCSLQNWLSLSCDQAQFDGRDQSIVKSRWLCPPTSMPTARDGAFYAITREFGSSCPELRSVQRSRVRWPAILFCRAAALLHDAAIEMSSRVSRWASAGARRWLSTCSRHDATRRARGFCSPAHPQRALG